MTRTGSRYASLNRAQLAPLVAEIAIEEWAAASPIYTRRIPVVPG
jgi:hypothetical protein